MSTKWEYLSVLSPNDAAMCSLGAEGWELVSVAVCRGWQERDHYGVTGETTYTHQAYFKRPLGGTQQKEN